MVRQPNSPYVFGGDVDDLHGPHVSWDEVKEPRVYDPEEREVVIVEGEAMSYRAYHRR